MRFLVDESTGPAVADWLTQQGHDVLSVYAGLRVKTDEEVLRRTVEERRIVITNDKDFGEMIYREGQNHQGVILLHLGDERSAYKIAALERLLAEYSDRVERRFVVVIEDRIRISK